MALFRLLGLPRSAKKYLLVGSLFFLIVLTWQTWQRVSIIDSDINQSYARNLDKRITGIESIVGARILKLRKNPDRLNGIIRMSIEGVLERDMQRDLPNDDWQRSTERKKKGKELLRRVHENGKIRKPEVRISNAKPSIHLSRKANVRQRAAKLNVSSTVITKVTIASTTREPKSSNSWLDTQSHRTLSDLVRTPTKIVLWNNRSHQSAEGQFRNFSEQKGSNFNKAKLIKGFLNMHTWFDICSDSVNSLRNFLLFPIAPTYRDYASTSDMTLNMVNFGQRLFGYVTPPTSGNYSFSISTRGKAELWLSFDKNPEHLRLVTRTMSVDALSGTHKGMSMRPNRNVSTPLELKSHELYYIEILHKHGSKSNDHLEILWRHSSAKAFSRIQSSYLTAFRDDFQKPTRYQYSDTRIKSFARDDTSLNKQSDSRSGAKVQESGDCLEDRMLEGVLEVCEYKPSYLIRHKLVRFQGARNKSYTRFLEIYPRDSSNESLDVVEEEWWKTNAVGNKLLHNSTVKDIARTFVESLDQKYPRKYTLRKIVSVRSTKDQHKGSRFFLNLELRETKTNSSKFFAKYVYRQKGDTTLCFPDKFRWNPLAVVHVVVPVKNASPWVLALVKNVEEVLTSTNDQKVNMVIADYDTQDLDIRQMLHQSSVKNYQVVSLPRNRPFRRAEALQIAANAVQDPNGILFFCDLHLSIPGNLFTLIRQHCVEGKMTFAPVVQRLRCGYYPSSPYGYWETLGFGLFAIYKSDFDRIGGMDTKTFKGWGGEDWELLDRVLMSGMEVERLKVPAFYHFYHSPLGSFNQRIDT